MGRRKIHWSERMTCSCGASFTDMYREAVHRHNFPALCKKKRTKSAAGKNNIEKTEGASDVTGETLETLPVTNLFQILQQVSK